MKFNLNEFISSMILLMMVLGIALLFSNEIILLVKSMRRMLTTNKFKKSILYYHLERLLSVVLKKAELKNEIDTFVAISTAIFLLFFVMLINQGFGLSALVYSAIFCMMPYVTLRVKLITTRHKSSYEGERLITEILNQYKINYYNIVSAIDRSVECLEKAPFSKIMLYRMARRLKTYTNTEELDKILDDFIYGINTEWSKKLSNNIHAALEEGSKIIVGLEDMLADCKEVTKLIEEEKRSNVESVIIAKYLGPVMYVGLNYMAFKYMDFSLKDLIEFQLLSQGGLRMLMAIIISCFGYFVIATIFSNQKYDF